MKQPTLRSATNPTTRHRQKPPIRKEMAPTLPCLQWRPRSVDRCSASPGSGRGWGNNTWVLYYNGWGFTHSGCIFCYPRDGGGGMDTSPSKCWHCFSHRALSWLCPCPFCPPAPVKQTLLPTLLLVGPKHVGNPDRFSQDKHLILYLGMEHNFVTSLANLIWLKGDVEFP